MKILKARFLFLPQHLDRKEHHIIIYHHHENLNEHVKYVSQLQFEMEFNAYQKIFVNLFKFSVLTRQLYPEMEWYEGSREEQNIVYQERIEEFHESYNEFSKTLETNAPFIPKDIYEMLISIRNLAREISVGYLDMRTIDENSNYFDRNKMTKDKYPKENEFPQLIKSMNKIIVQTVCTIRKEAICLQHQTNIYKQCKR